MGYEHRLFMIAINNKDVQQVESYLKRIKEEKQSSILNTVNKHKETALHVAASVGSVEIINLLLKYQAEVNVFNLRKQSPLHKPVIGGHEEAAKELIRAGTKLNYKDATRRTVLSYAINNNMIVVIKELIKFGASATKDAYLIHSAIRTHSLEVVKILHYAGGSLIEEDRLGRTPLIAACCYEQFSIAEYLLKNGVSPNTITRIHYMTALRCCIREMENPDVFKQFLELLIAHDMNLKLLTIRDYPNNNEILCIMIKYCLGVNCPTEWWFRNCLSFVIHRGITSYDDLNRLVKLLICAGFNFKDFTNLMGRCDDEILKFIEHSMSSPRCLKDLCRIRVRKLLGRKAMLNLYKLDLPKALHKFLALEIL